jgi:hypothetical protein
MPETSGTCPFCASDLTEPDLCPICGSLEGVEEEDEAVVPHSASAAGEEQPQGTVQSCTCSSEPQSFFPVPHHIPSIRHIMAMSRSGHCAHLVAMNDEYCRQFAGPSSSSTLTACSTSWAAWLRASTRTWSRSWPIYSRG